MYSVVLMAALTTGVDLPDFGRRGGGCCGCHGGGYGGGYGMGYGGCYGGGYGMGYGGCYGMGMGYGGCYGMGMGYGMGVAYGGCYGMGGMGYGMGGYSSAYPKDPSETDEEYNFCIEESTKMPSTEYPSFRERWKALSHPERKRMMDEKKKRDGDTSLSLPARIVVSLPADAKLTFEDEATTSIGTTRVFVSPPLSPEGSYEYTVKAEFVRDGKTVSLTRKVGVSAGEEAAVSFSDAPQVSVASK